MTCDVLFLTKQLNHSALGGRGMLSNLNCAALSKIFGERLHVFELPNVRLKSHIDIINSFRGHIDGLNDQTIEDIIILIQHKQIRRVFVDGSNLGAFIAVLKKRLPLVDTTTFFHNVEARFFWGAFLAARTPRALGILVANFLAERHSTCLSDKRICLSERDSRLLKKLYGKHATHVSPLALEDKLDVSHFEKSPVSAPFALFVGGNFYANRQGIIWFAENVAPFINIRICVIGKGMDELRSQLEIPNRVRVVGTVESLSKWYHFSRFVIAPIFDGSGMKTKVAEALMHGKKVVGTPEAFSGYEHVASRAGWCCNSADEFVSSINIACSSFLPAFDPELRELYQEYYSLNAATLRLSSTIFMT